ncbi:hypothetical protein ACUL41_17400 [Virgibacillus natechei]
MNPSVLTVNAVQSWFEKRKAKKEEHLEEVNTKLEKLYHSLAKKDI